MDVKKVDKIPIEETNFVDVTRMGNVFEVQYMERKNNTCVIQMIDKNHYVFLPTGEVFLCNHIEDRSCNLNSLRITMRSLRQLINCNVADVSFCRWVTITYKENMTDSKKLYKDIEKLIKRVRYKFGHFEYIHVAEPQGRGAWHLHCLWVFDKPAPYIDQKWLSACWGLGSNVVVKRLDGNVDDLGSYLTAYLCDVPLDDVLPEDVLKNSYGIKEILCIDDGKEIKKKILKGARLHMYPPKFNLYRCSRGIKRPKKETMSYFQAKEKISSAKLTFESSVIISDDGFRNVITKEYYNTKRK